MRNNKELVITRPDKGKGVVLMKKSDYLEKMHVILDDKKKFKRIGEARANDHTARAETSLQNMLRKLHKNNEIDDDTYDLIRPVGTIRPRMYGVPKVHKDGKPLRPILSMVNSPQHATAQWIAKLLRPVAEKLGKYTLKDSFEFADTIKELKIPRNAHMASFDIKSLFTNVPVEETINICAQELYHSDLEKPKIKEESFKELIKKVTTGVEFSFDDVMYRQVDGVAMGSPLGPVLANIFVGYCEITLNLTSSPEVLLYRRFVDDIFSINENAECMEELLTRLRGMHKALEFTKEEEIDGQLPFMDVSVIKNKTANNENITLSTTIYRKPTFTGHYMKWKSFTSRQHKLNLVRCLVNRAKRLCTIDQLDGEIGRLKVIFKNNGYPIGILERTVTETLTPMSRPKPIGPQRCPVYLRIPWMGDVTSGRMEKKVRNITRRAYPVCQTRVVFTSKPMLPTSVKDRLPTHQQSNLIYLYSCRCGCRYVGKTTQRLETRAKQHVPAILFEPAKDNKKRNSTSSIGQHLLDNVECLENYDLKMFSIICRARSENILHILEPLFIKSRKPDLCKQLEFVRKLSLFK